MKTLVVYYSKTGTTKKVAQTVVARLNCDFDEISYDEKADEIQCAHSPSDYERVILLSPVWAFSLAAPMKQYLARYHSEIRNYRLVVTCSGLGLRGCVANCKKAIGKPPEKALKLRAKTVLQGDFDIGPVL